MTKKKQSKKSAKQGAKKSSRPGVAPTLQEIPAVKPEKPPELTVVEPAAETSAPTAEQPSAEIPAKTAEQPAAETPAETTEQPAADTSAKTTEQPAAETPAKTTEQPAAETPAKTTEQPAAETSAHAAEQPAAQISAQMSQTEPLSQASQTPLDAHTLSAPEPIHPEQPKPDIAVQPSGHTSIATAITEQQSTAETSTAPTPPDSNGSALSAAPTNVQITTPSSISGQSNATIQAPSSTPAQTNEPIQAPSQSITNDIPMPSTIAQTASEPISEPSVTAPSSGSATGSPTPPSTDGAPQVQKTIYDIEAMGSAPTAAPAPTPPTGFNNAPSLNPQSLGSLTRSKSSSEVSRGLPGKDDGYKWRPPVDYFGASASAFSSSFSGNSNRDLNAIKRPADAAQTTNPTSPGAAPAAMNPAAPAGTPAPEPTSGPTPGAASGAASGGAAAAPASPTGSAPSTAAGAAPPDASNGQPPVRVYESTTDASALSPKMAKFVSNLRQMELTASGASSPVLPQMEATSVDMNALPKPDLTPPKITPVARAEVKPVEIKPVEPIKTIESVRKEQAQANAGAQATAAETSRDLTPLAKVQPETAPNEPKSDEKPFAPKSSSAVEELRESIISQRADKPEDWHPVTQKKPRRQADAQMSADLDDLKKSDPERAVSKQKAEPERHLSLEEMAAMDPDLILAPQTPQQQSIRRLKSKVTGGIHAEIYIPIYIICLGLAWVTEQSAAAGTCRDAGQRIESTVQLIAPKTLADNFMTGVNAYDDRDIKLHPFNPSKPRSIPQILFSRMQAFCWGISSAFGRLPAALTASAATNPIAEIMILLSYAAVMSLSLMIYFKFKRSTSWIIADFLLLPIGMIAASTMITAVFIAVLSTSASLGARYLPNTIVLYTTIAMVLAVFDMARRSFFRRKQELVRD